MSEDSRFNQSFCSSRYNIPAPRVSRNSPNRSYSITTDRTSRRYTTEPTLSPARPALHSSFTSINDHIKQLIQNETNLKLQINAQEKENSEIKKHLAESERKIEEMELYISEQDRQINNLKETNNSLNQYITELQINADKITDEKIYTSKQIANLKEENRKQNEKLLAQSQGLIKLERSSEMMEGYKAQLESLKNKYEQLMKENQTLNFDLTTLKEDLEETSKACTSFKAELEKVYKENQLLKQNNTDLDNINRKINEDNYRITREFDKLNETKTGYEKDMQNKTEKFNRIESQNVNMKNLINNIIYNVNEDYLSLSRWIETYMPMQFKDKVQLPEIQIVSQKLNEELSQNSYKKLNYDILVQKIYQTKTQVDNLLNKHSDETKDSKFKLTVSEEEKLKIIKFLENLLSNIKYEIESNKYFKITSDVVKGKKDGYDTLLAEIEEILAKVFTLLQKWKNFPETEEIINSLQNENQLLKENLCALDQTISVKQRDFEDINNENMGLRKRFAAFDQLKLENRKLLDELKEQQAILEEQKTTGRALQEVVKDKENLIKDNVTLIKENEELRRHIMKITQRFQQSNETTMDTKKMIPNNYQNEDEEDY
ncbi:MAG: hypothetical protein MJ252_26700 [archaeon]|nr:hypothetical protein [archaeon]